MATTAPPATGIDPPKSGHAYTPLEVAASYHFPTGQNGAGQTIGLIESGGGYRQEDLDTIPPGYVCLRPALWPCPLTTRKHRRHGRRGLPLGRSDRET